MGIMEKIDNHSLEHSVRILVKNEFQCSRVSSKCSCYCITTKRKFSKLIESRRYLRLNSKNRKVLNRSNRCFNST